MFSAAHFLVVIPAENCQLSLSLQGVRAPQSSAKGATPAVFGDESLLYTRYFFLQVGVSGGF